MPIRFIPNDPLAIAVLPDRIQLPRADRAANQAGFSVVGAVAEDQYDIGTPEFLFWQCREAALTALETWEALDGGLPQWARAQPDPRRLELLQDEGSDLNAYYDGLSLSFFEHTTGAKTTFSGASTDVVSHEAGHAFLDAIRPDLWERLFTETAAFHEAFGDCMAILTALFDAETRRALLAVSPDLGATNFVEVTMEDLADGVLRARGVNDPSSAPRHALNDFRWQLPATLPPSGPPAVLSREAHSFGRIFSGCFYDTLRNIFTALPAQDEASLLEAATITGRLLIAGARTARETPRFFRDVGRAMIFADETEHGGTHRLAIRNAFARHRIALGGAAMLTPTAVLAGRAPRAAVAPATEAPEEAVVMEARRSVRMAPDTRRDLLTRIGAPPHAPLSLNAVQLGGETVAEAIYQREVSLEGLSERLQGVVAVVPESILVGNEAGRSAVLGTLPEPTTTADEVRTFVESLLQSDAIDFAEKTSRGRRAHEHRSAVAGASTSATPVTHSVRKVGRKKVLERIRFVCGESSR